MNNIPLPKEVSIKKVSADRSEIIITPCYPGFGTTLGNALRRVLFSSIGGAAAIAVKIKNASHEFSTLPNVKEDVVDIILNIKNLRFEVEGDEQQEISLHVKGEKKVKGSDFAKNSQAKVVNGDLVIATLTDKSAELDLKIIVQKGRGYAPVESREKEKFDVGYIAIDAIYTPVKNVNFKVEHVRVEQMTNYDKLILDIATDGTITPESAFTEATKILDEHFQFILKSDLKKVK